MYFITSVNDQKPNVNNQFFVYFILSDLLFVKKSDSMVGFLFKLQLVKENKQRNWLFKFGFWSQLM